MAHLYYSIMRDTNKVLKKKLGIDEYNVSLGKYTNIVNICVQRVWE